MLAIKPANVSFGEAAALPGAAMTALICLGRVNIEKESSSSAVRLKVLINGASGAVGTNAVQIAKYFGAEVTAVCSTSNIDLVKSIGADSVIDYTKEDFTKRVLSYDVVFDAVGMVPAARAKMALKENGIYLNVLRHSGSGEVLGDLLKIKDFVEKGYLKTVIDRSYSLEQIPEAHEYVQKGHKKGNVVIRVI